MIVADDGGRGRGGGGRGGRKETARLGIGAVRWLLLLLLSVVNVSMRKTGAATGRWLAVADRQQRLAVSVGGGNAVAPQAVLALLKRRRATPNEGPASLLAACGTAYIHINPRLSSVDLSIISSRGGRHLRVAPLSRRCVSLVIITFLFFFYYYLIEGNGRALPILGFLSRIYTLLTLRSLDDRARARD